MATTRSTKFYNQYDFRRYMTEADFRLIVDSANAKYNGAAWRTLGSWDTPSDSKVWNQASRTVPIMARASYLSAHAPKPMRNTSGWKFYTGNTPKFGHGYTFDEDDMFQLRDARNNTGRNLQDLIYESLLVNAQQILGGIPISSLTCVMSWLLQVVSQIRVLTVLATSSSLISRTTSIRLFLLSGSPRTQQVLSLLSPRM